MESQQYETLINHLVRVTQELTEIKDQQQAIHQQLTVQEQEMGAKINALFDARELQFDANERIVGALNRIETKLDRLQLRTLPMVTEQKNNFA